jgi:hypothetical protein
MFTGLVCADNGPTLPSRKVAIVLPLLKQISGKDAYPQIEKILGKPDRDIGSGVYVYVFGLDDDTTLIIGTDRNKVFHISRIGYGIKGSEDIFPLTKPQLF